MANPPVAVSIGLPVFNGGRSLAGALDSLLAQTFRDFELIISDNGSSDETEAVCRSYAARDRRIRYVRQSANRGVVWNFDYVLKQARGPYFMWAGADDLWAPTFVEENARVLSAEPDVIASISKARLMTRTGAVLDQDAGTGPLMAAPEQNLRKFLRNPGYNSRMYALYRTDVLRRSVTAETHVAADWLVVARALRFGKYREVPQRLFTRSTVGESSDFIQIVRRYNVGRLNRLFPMLPFTRSLMNEPHLPRDPGTYVILLCWNVKSAIGMLKRYTLLAARAVVRKPRSDP